MFLHQLIYISTAVPELDRAGRNAIVDASTRNNAPNGITGLLLYSHGTFMQILEGESEVLDRTFERIQRDPRHHSIHLLIKTASEKRDFPDWSMGFREMAVADALRWEDYAQLFRHGFKADQIGAAPDIALSLLKCLANQDKRGT